MDRFGVDDDILGWPSARRFQILALSGGGFRGLFSASVIARLDDHSRRMSGRPLADCFDLIAGTSVGGILAGALAAGVAPAAVRDGIRTHGPRIFHRSRLSRVLLGAKRLFKAPYHSEILAAAIDAIVPSAAELKLNAIGKPLLLTAVSHTEGGPYLLRSRGLSSAQSSSLSLREAALATASAPTYFSPCRLGSHNLVDGGLIANAPELVAVTEAMHHLGVPLERIHVLSVGTAATPFAARPHRLGKPGLLRLAGSLFELTLCSQEKLVAHQCKTLLGVRYLRIDRSPAPQQQGVLALDNADQSAIDLLELLAAQVSQAIDQGEYQGLADFLRHHATTAAPSV